MYGSVTGLLDEAGVFASFWRPATHASSSVEGCQTM